MMRRQHGLSTSCSPFFGAVAFLAIGVLGHAGRVSVRAGDDQLPGIADVRAAVDAWRESFATIRIRWHEWNENDLRRYKPDVPADQYDGKEHVAWELLWSDEGFARQELRQYDGGTSIWREMDGFGTGVSWDAVTRRGGSQEAFHLSQIGAPHPEHPLRSMVLLSGIIALWDSEGRWFAERLHDDGWTVSAQENVGGAPCVLVERQTETAEERFWLDIKKEYLPRKWMRRRNHTTVVPPATEPYGWGAWVHWEADTFREFDDGRWFPASGRKYDEDNNPSPGFVWSVKEVEFNIDLPRSLFEPLRQPGLKVIDKLKVDTYTIGPDGRPVAPPRPNAAVESPLPSPRADSVEATVNQTPWLYVALLCSAILIAAILTKWYRRALDRRSP